MIQVPELTEAHEKLKALVGTWRGTETIRPSPFDPKGGAALGIVSNRLALDGFAVIQDYEQQRDGRTNFRGHGIFRWDSNKNAYLLHWLDSVGGPLSDMRGSFKATSFNLSARARLVRAAPPSISAGNGDTPIAWRCRRTGSSGSAS